MHTFLQRFDRFGIAMTVLIGTVVSMLHATDCFRGIDDWIVDHWQRLSRAPAGEEVLLVATPETFWGDTSGSPLARLVRKAGELEARTIAIAAPDSAEPHWAAAFSQTDRVVLSTGPVDDRGESPTPDSQARDSHDTAQAVHRRFATRPGATDFERRIARHWAGESSANRTPPLGAKLRYAGALPRVDASRLLRDELVPELVRGRAVIIAPVNPSSGRRYHLPFATGRSVDELEWKGQVVRCLIAGDWVRKMSFPFSAGLILFGSVIAVQLFRNLGARWWPLCLAWSIALSVSAVFSMLSWYRVEVPGAALISTAFASHFWVTRQRFRVLRSALDRRFNESHSNAIRVDSNSIIREEPTDVWMQAADAWSNLFAPTRVALLELDDGDTYLRVRAMAGADASDIGERRRDVTRMPFRDAVDQKTATELTEEIFFTATVAEDAQSAAFERDRTQFAVPLIAGKTIGVVILEIESSRLAGWDAFGDQAMDFANELATHLSSHRQKSPLKNVRGTSWSRAAGLPEQWMAASIVDSSSVAKAADDLWMRAFETATNPIAVCDAFGRLVQANSAMISVLQHNGQTLNEFDATEWLQAITGRSREECSTLLRRIVLQHRGEKLFCKSDAGQTLTPILMIRPLSREGEDRAGLAARAMSLELISPSMFTNATNWERTFAKYQRDAISRRARRCLNVTRGHDLESGKLGNAADHPTTGTPDDWDSVLREIDALVSLCQEHQESLSESPTRSTYLRLDEVLSQAIDDCRTVAETKGIGLTVDREANLPEADLNPYYLSHLFRTLVECVTSDASAGENISLSVCRQGPNVVFDFLPSGMRPKSPEERMHDHPLDGRLGEGLRMLPAAIADEIHRAQLCVRSWGGTLRVECSDDFRISVHMTIQANRIDQVDAAADPGLTAETTTGLRSGEFGASP